MGKIFTLLLILHLMLIEQTIAQIVITVSTSEELQYAILNAQPGYTILISDGTYDINNDYFVVTVDSITIGSVSGHPESVVIDGDGMEGNDYGFIILGNDVTISNITIQNVRYNCISTGENTDGLHVNNCILRDAGDFFLYISWFSALSPSENGIIENCIFEYPAGSGVQSYVGGIQGYFCKDWIIRNNVFKSIRSPLIGSTAYAILFWNDSDNILVEKNLIIDCDRGIGFGIGIKGNSGGIIRNNLIYHRNIIENDQIGISLESSPYTQIYNNTIYFEQDVISSIEYRFDTSKEIYIANNLTNEPILMRDGASGIDTNNVTISQPSWFRDLTTGDLHLSSDTLSEVIDQGIAISGLFDDFDGDIRPQGLGIDVGADEYTSSTDIDRFNSGSILPKIGQLHQNYPNPFNPSTTIKFELFKTGNVTLKVFNILGEEVATLVSDRLTAGSYTYKWSRPVWPSDRSAGMASGVYLYRLYIESLTTKSGHYVGGETVNFTTTKKMILMK